MLSMLNNDTLTMPTADIRSVLSPHQPYGSVEICGKRGSEFRFPAICTLCLPRAPANIFLSPAKKNFNILGVCTGSSDAFPPYLYSPAKPSLTTNKIQTPKSTINHPIPLKSKPQPRRRTPSPSHFHDAIAIISRRSSSQSAKSTQSSQGAIRKIICERRQ